MKKLSIAVDLLAAPTALALSELAAIEGGADNTPEEFVVGFVDPELEKQRQDWVKAHPKDPNAEPAKGHEALLTEP